MGFEKVEYEFPHESKGIEVEETEAVEIDVTGKKTADEYREESDDSGDIEVEVVDDTPPKDRGKEEWSDSDEDVSEEELKGYGKSVRNRIDKIQKKYHDERRAKETTQREREELERVAQKLVEENKALKGDVAKNRDALIEQAKRSTAIEVLQAKKQYKDAYEAGDADKVLEAQEKLTSAKIKAEKIQNFKPEPLQEPDSDVGLDESPAQPIDPKAKAWQDANKSWFGVDDEITSYALGLHSKLVKQGVDPTSDEYYEKIDSRVRELFPDNFEDAPKKKRARSVVAPATRSTAPKKVTLTQTQVTLAKRLGLTNEQYAKQLAHDMRNAQ
jgi:hypothetical protein